MREELIEPTPERIAKGGLVIHRDSDGNFLSTMPSPQTLLDLFIYQGKLDPHYRDFADAFLELRHAFLSDVKPRTSSYGDKQNQSMSIAASRYLHIVKKKLKPQTLNDIFTALQPPSPNPLKAALYRLAFDSLGEALGETNGEVTNKKVDEEWAAIMAGIRKLNL